MAIVWFASLVVLHRGHCTNDDADCRGLWLAGRVFKSQDSVEHAAHRRGTFLSSSVFDEQPLIVPCVRLADVVFDVVGMSILPLICICV